MIPTLGLIVAEEIEDASGGPRIDQFSSAFLSDYLSDEDRYRIKIEGLDDLYGIVKKRRYEEEGRTIATIQIPYFLVRYGFSSIPCPKKKGDYTDAELHERLPITLKDIDDAVTYRGLKGLVLATETTESKIVRKSFEDMGYKIHEFEITS